jgi:hydroxyquinol 1,2-dioxygenase
MSRDFDEQSITHAVLERFANTPDPRLKQIMNSLTQHLHDFVRDVEPTIPEWEFAIGFLTGTGHLSDDKRQEFILLSDTLGVSMLVDAINHRQPSGATETTVLGPFYVQNPPELPNGASISGGEPGEPLYFSGQVTTPGGVPIANAWVDVWQSDDDGYYDVQKPGDEPRLRARFRSDADGRFTLWTIVPSFYPIPADGTVGAMLTATNRHPFRPAHIHFMIGAQGFETLVTHLFIEGDQYLDSDAVFGVKQSLIVTLDDHEGGKAPDGLSMAGAWKSYGHRFGLKAVD